MKKLLFATSVAAIAMTSYMMTFKDGYAPHDFLNIKRPSVFSQADIPIIPTSSGAYLASRAAQYRNEWENAAQFLDDALIYASAKNSKVKIEKTGPVLTGPVTANDMEQATKEAARIKIKADKGKTDNTDKNDDAALAIAELKERVLIFNLGGGNFDAALQQAKEIVFDEEQSKKNGDNISYDRLGFARALLAVNAFRLEQWTTLEKKLKTLDSGTVAQSMKPLLSVWHKIAESKAAQESIDIEGLTKEIQKAPLMPLHRAYALEALGNIDAAQKQYELIARKADSIAADLTLAGFYLRHDKNADATKVTDVLASQYPDDKEIKDLQNAIAKGTALSDPMIISLSAHTKSPKHAMAISLYEMAMSHIAGHSYETALLMGQMAYALTKDLNQVNFMLADILKERGNYEEALEILDNTQPDNYAYAEAVIARAEILEKMDKVDDAIALLQATLEDHKDADIAYHLAGLYRADDEYEKALQAYNQVEEYIGGTLPERLWSVYYYRGVILSELNRWDEAEKQLLLARESSPDNPFVLNYLGYSWVDNNKNVKQGLEILKTALELSPQSGFITDSVGWAYYKLGQYDEATGYLERAAELMPYDPEVNDHVGDLYWRTGRKLEAYYQWQRAIDYADIENPDQAVIAEAAKKKMETGL